MAASTYHTDVRWTGEHWGELRCGNGPTLAFSGPPDVQGHEGVLTPEDAFVGAVNMCVMLMFVWACERLRLDLISYECHAEGTKVVALDRTETLDRLVLRPRVTVRGADRKRLDRALEWARKYSLIANSITSTFVMEPEIEIQS